MKKKLTLEEKRNLCNADVTLDGHSAGICGAKLDFGWVVRRDNSNRVEFAWETIAYVVKYKGGNFKS